MLKATSTDWTDKGCKKHPWQPVPCKDCLKEGGKVVLSDSESGKILKNATAQDLEDLLPPKSSEWLYT